MGCWLSWEFKFGGKDPDLALIETWLEFKKTNLSTMNTLPSLAQASAKLDWVATFSANPTHESMWKWNKHTWRVNLL